MESITISALIKAEPEALFYAWLDSKEHSRFTGSTAAIEHKTGGAFTAWDGYISGTTLIIDPPKRIVQCWRTTEFPPDAPDSRLEIYFIPEGEHTKITLHHSQIPDGQGEMYKQGWDDHYFAPMRTYFGE